MSLKAKLPIWVFVLIAAIGLATSFLLVNYGISVLGEMDLQSLEDAYWTKKISQKDTLADWQTYRNYEYGFEIKYPPNFIVKEYRNTNDTQLIEFSNQISRETFTVSFSKLNPKKLDIAVWADQQEWPFPDNWRSHFSIKSISQLNVLQDPKTGSIILTKGDKIYNIDNGIGINPVLIDLNTFNQILSTFKFIEGRVTENGYKIDYIYKTGASGIIESSQLVFVSPEGEKILIPDNIAILIDGPTQDITSFDMPPHPQNKDIIFLSTYEPLNKASSRIANRIYSYNLKTSELKEIYYEVAENNSPIDDSKARILITVGIEGSKIIVLYDDPENWPGPCTRIWYHYKDQMGYLDLADVQSGLKAYTVPAYKVEEDRIEANKCLEEL